MVNAATPDDENSRRRERIKRNIELIVSNESKTKSIIQKFNDASPKTTTINKALDSILLDKNFFLEINDESLSECDVVLDNLKTIIGVLTNNAYTEKYFNDLLKESEKVLEIKKKFSKNAGQVKITTDDNSIFTLPVENTNMIIQEIRQNIELQEQQIKKLQSNETQIELTSLLTQIKVLFQEAEKSKELIYDSVKELINAAEGHTAYHLAIELQKKSEQNNTEMKEKKKAFTNSFSMIILLNFLMIVIYFFNPWIQNFNVSVLIITKFSILLPFIFYTFFCLNEYTKAKRLYEEFDYKKIMAQTLMNNYNRLKGDFTQDEDKLLDLLKAPIEKIFDNPVHSVYGDKSGDKGLGIDQLEKLVSIAEKLKGK
jgi:hypothetical protein